MHDESEKERESEWDACVRVDACVSVCMGEQVDVSGRVRVREEPEKT